MTLQQAAADLHQEMRIGRRAGNVHMVGIDETHNRIVVYTIKKEKQPWRYAHMGFPVAWIQMGKLKPC